MEFAESLVASFLNLTLCFPLAGQSLSEPVVSAGESRFFRMDFKYIM